MKRINKIIITFVITIALLLNQGLVVHATSLSSASKILGAGRNFINNGKTDTPISMGEAENLLPLGRIVMAIALGILVVVGMIMGVKYMISGADERANMKQKLIWYLVAAALIMAPIGIYNIVVDVMSAAGLD